MPATSSASCGTSLPFARLHPYDAPDPPPIVGTCGIRQGSGLSRPRMPGLLNGLRPVEPTEKPLPLRSGSAERVRSRGCEFGGTRPAPHAPVNPESLMNDEVISNLIKQLHSTLDGAHSINEKDR